MELASGDRMDQTEREAQATFSGEKRKSFNELRTASYPPLDHC